MDIRLIIIEIGIGMILGNIVFKAGISNFIKGLVALLWLVFYIGGSYSLLVQNKYKEFLLITLATAMMVIITFVFFKIIRKVFDY